MAVTNIREIRNNTSSLVRVRNFEDATDTSDGRGDFAPGQVRQFPVDSLTVPWCGDLEQGAFAEHHIRVEVVGGLSFAIWQASHDGVDRVRVSTDGAWHQRGDVIGGFAAVGWIEELAGGKDRTLVVNDGSIWLLPFALSLELSTMSADVRDKGYRLIGPPVGPPADRDIPSVPKHTAVAFSMAGPASDAFDRRQAGARFAYRDSGKRYELRIDGGKVGLQPAVLGRSKLEDVISFRNRRLGEASAVPELDMVAASGGRVFAKEKGSDRFYFAILDEGYIHAGPNGTEFTVPSSCLVLDPEFNAEEGKSEHLVEGSKMEHHDFAGHPAAERWPAYRLLLRLGLMPVMLVRVRRLTWHLLDTRPPLGGDTAKLQEKLEAVAKDNELVLAVLAWITGLSNLALPKAPQPPESPGALPPDGVATYPHAVYRGNSPHPEVNRHSIAYRRVLDIGVGHVHHHEQYEGVTGGEVQPFFIGKDDPNWLYNAAEHYRFMFGPVRDGDGYIDGTCNFYALVQLADDATISEGERNVSLRRRAYAGLWIDEQTFFTERWHLIDPDDHEGALISIVERLETDPDRYGWKPQLYWCPFRTGHIGPRSRMAVAAQVVMVTGEDPVTKVAMLFSINFSFGTIDRTWRWRKLPAPARYFDGQSLWSPAMTTVTGSEVVPEGTDVCVYPQTARLREDMTVCLSGRGPGRDGRIERGRWYQRYLPATNQLVPSAANLIAGQRPPKGYEHPWKFLPESVFALADRFSHFGVYDVVDSRMQYYLVTPASPADDAALAAGQAGAWIDDASQLGVETYGFRFDWMRIPWPATVPPPLETRQRPSLFNPDVRLRIVRRGKQWIAMHWDKRDDDLMPFADLPKTVTLRFRRGPALSEGDGSVRVSLRANRWVEQPPAVSRAYFGWEASDSSGEARAVVGFVTPRSQEGLSGVWRVCIAALDPARPGSAVPLFSREIMGNFVPMGTGVYEYRWTPAADEGTRLQQYCTPAGTLRYGTSIWFEDVVGHVSVAEKVQWRRALVSATPSPITLGAPTRVVVHSDVPGRAIVENFDSARRPVRHEFRTGTPTEITFHWGLPALVSPAPRPKLGAGQLPEPIEPQEPLAVLPTGIVLPDDAGIASAPVPFVFVEPNAAFVAQNMPASMIAGRTTVASVTLRNTGDVTWTASSGFRLGSQNPQDSRTWGLARVAPPASVPPGAEVVFRFTVTAPGTSGTYNFQWCMLQEAVRWFGSLTPNVAVTVRDMAALRESVRREAYFIWRDRLHRGVRGDARGDWLAARAKLGVPTDLYL